MAKADKLQDQEVQEEVKQEAVNGEQVKEWEEIIGKEEEIYKNRLKQEQRKNNRLGYGSNVISWKEEKYIEERRRLIQIEREEKYYGEQGT